MMVMDSVNAIIIIFLANYNLFLARKHTVKTSPLQDSYHMICYFHYVTNNFHWRLHIVISWSEFHTVSQYKCIYMTVMVMFSSI